MEYLSEDEINDLVLDLGFHRKSDRKDPDPEEYKDGTIAPPGGTTVEQLKRGTSKWSEYGEILEPPRSAESVLPLDRMKQASLKAQVRAFVGDVKSRQLRREDL